MEYLLPLTRLTQPLDRALGPGRATLVVLGATFGTALLLLVLVRLLFPGYASFVLKSLRRNILRTALASLAVMMLVFVITLVGSVLVLLDLVMTERAKDFKMIVSERLQLPSQMPPAYQNGLEEGGYSKEGDIRVNPQDSMTWSFYGGSTDKDKVTFESVIFFFVMDPRKIKTMMDELDVLDDEIIRRMIERRNGCILGRDRLKKMQKRVGETFTVYSLNYKGIDLEFEIVGEFPDNPRWNQSAIMNRDYLYSALEQYKRDKKKPHPLEEKSLALVWLRVPDSETFSKLSNQIMASPQFTSPYVKSETAASGIAAFLEPYRDILNGVKWGLLPVLSIIMALVMAMAISISVRERRTEMAVLKVLGYTPRRVLLIVLGEAILVGGTAGLVSGALSYGLVHGVLGGFAFPIAFFGVFDIFPDALWWGPVLGTVTTFAGSIAPAWSARSVKVSEVFSKIA